ncbi:MAG: PH domain-containing protein [Bacteroidota bacterium]
MTEEITLNEASFNPKVKTYIFFVVLFFLITSIIGILVVPFWVFGLGQWLSGKFFKTLSCRITNKNLRFSKGLIIHIEKTIPLENIQDLSFVGGPILRYFGLTLIKIETAGGGGGHHNQNMMSMLGINGAETFKTEILEQREKVIREKHGYGNTVSVAPAPNVNDAQLLTDIKNELIEIKNVLKKNALQ